MLVVRGARPLAIPASRTVSQLPLSTVGCPAYGTEARSRAQTPAAPRASAAARTSSPRKTQLPEPKWLRVRQPSAPPLLTAAARESPPLNDDETRHLLLDVFSRLVESKAVTVSRKTRHVYQASAATAFEPTDDAPAQLHDGTDVSIPAVELAAADDATAGTPSGARGPAADPLGPMAGDSLIKKVLPALREGDVKTAVNHLGREVRQWKYLLSNLGRRGQLSDQALVWNAAVDLGVPLDAVCCSIMIRTHYRYKNWNLVTSYCTMAHDSGLLKGAGEWLMWLHALGRQDSFKLLAETFRTMVSVHGLRPTPAQLGAVMYHYGRAGNLRLVLAYFARFDEYKLPFGPVECSILLFALCTNGHHSLAVELLEEARRRDVPGANDPSVVAHLVAPLVQAGLLQEARQAFDRVPPGERTTDLYAAYMTALTRTRRNEDVARLYEELKRDGVPVNVPIFHAAAKACRNFEQLDGVIADFNASSGLWTFDVYGNVIRILAMFNRRRQAEHYLEEYVRAHRSVTTGLVYPFVYYMLRHPEFGAEAEALAEHFRFIKSPDGTWSADVADSQRHVLPDEWTALRQFIRKTQRARREGKAPSVSEQA